MRRSKKYTIFFKKSHNFVGFGNYCEIKDSVIFKTLNDLSETYDFQIKKIKLRNYMNKSFIKIKCNPSDKNKILCDFCEKLSGKIEAIEF